MSKTVNYSAEAVATMSKMYTEATGGNAAVVAKIATTINKSQASVRAKLSNLGLYKSESTYTAHSAVKNTKQSIAESIASMTNLSEVEIEGLAKATKSPLQKILQQLTNQAEELAQLKEELAEPESDEIDFEAIEEAPKEIEYTEEDMEADFGDKDMLDTLEVMTEAEAEAQYKVLFPEDVEEKATATA